MFNLTNKSIFKFFPYPWTVSTVHVGVGAIYCLLTYALGFRKASFGRVRLSRLSPWWAANAFFAPQQLQVFLWAGIGSRLKGGPLWGSLVLKPESTPPMWRQRQCLSSGCCITSRCAFAGFPMLFHAQVNRRNTSRSHNSNYEHSPIPSSYRTSVLMHIQRPCPVLRHRPCCHSHTVPVFLSVRSSTRKNGRRSAAQPSCTRSAT